MTLLQVDARIIGPEHDTTPGSFTVLWRQLLAKLRKGECQLDSDPEAAGSPFPTTPVSQKAPRATSTDTLGTPVRPKPAKGKARPATNPLASKRDHANIKDEEAEHVSSDETIVQSKKRKVTKKPKVSPAKEVKSMSPSPGTVCDKVEGDCQEIKAEGPLQVVIED
jgi:hypothetical protein